MDKELTVENLGISEDSQSEKSDGTWSSGSSLLGRGIVETEPKIEIKPEAEAASSWANESEEDEELKKLNREIPKETDSLADRREWMGNLLKHLQISSVFFMTGGTVRLRDEDIAALKSELDASLDDLMEMEAFSEATFASNPKLLKKQRPQPPSTGIRQIDRLRIVSWDVGMLSYKYMGTRAKAIADLILKDELDIVFLQEVNPFVYKYLLCRLHDKYQFSRGRKPEGRFIDFTVTLVRLDTVTFLSSKIVYYPNTRERRTLLKTEVQVGNTKLCLMNTHLESMLGNSKFRMMQLQKCYDICGSLPSDFNVILCGSFNVREWEVAKMKIPKNLIDLWETFGDKTNQFSWDLKVNKLIQMPGSGWTPDESLRRPPPSPQPQKRFGRIYFRGAKQSLINPSTFGITGKNIVAAKKYHASDHWALVSHFRVSFESYCQLERDHSEELDAHFSQTADLLEGEDGKVKKEVAQEVVKDSWDDSD